jgi:hypothetical protein
VLLDVEWIGSNIATQQKRSVLAYHKTDIVGLQNFLWEKLPTWANNGSCVEDIWKNFKGIIFEGIERFVPRKILKQNPDPEYYNREVKRLKVKVRRAYNRRKLGDHYQQELKRLSQKLLLAKRNAQETFLCTLLQNEGKSWAEFYRYVKRRKGNRENIPMIRDYNGRHITDPVEKANNLNNYYSSVFSYERDIPEIKTSHRYEPFTIKINIIRKRLAMIGRNKSVGPDDIPGDILKMGGEAMIPYLARLIDISINKSTLPADWKKAIVVPIYKGGGRTVVPQGSVLGPLLFLAYVNDIWRNIESKIRLFADDCIIYRKIVNNHDVKKLQTDLDRLGDWAVENEMKINPSKSKALSFTRVRVKDPLNYTLRDEKIPENSSCKY